MMSGRKDRGGEAPWRTTGRRFCTLMARADGRCDVYMDGNFYPVTDGNGQTDYDICIRVVRDIDPEDFQPDLETHIREHWDDWCSMAEVVWL